MGKTNFLLLLHELITIRVPAFFLIRYYLNNHSYFEWYTIVSEINIFTVCRFVMRKTLGFSIFFRFITYFLFPLPVTTKSYLKFLFLNFSFSLAQHLLTNNALFTYPAVHFLKYFIPKYRRDLLYQFNSIFNFLFT